MIMIKKYLKKHVFREERQKIIDELNQNSIIMKYQKMKKVSQQFTKK